MSASTPSTKSLPRLIALDQFRGYTVAGMFLVNFMGSFQVCPYLWRHSNNYCSYADTIMPQFFFAAGFALRLSFLRRQQLKGEGAAWGRMIRRVLSLALVAILFYGYDEFSEIRKKLPEIGLLPVLYWLFKGPLFQTLLHIAVTSLWILPVLWTSGRVRIAYAIGSGLLHLGLSYLFYYDWVYAKPGSIDGGPLGFLTWSIPTLAGTIACDYWMASHEPPKLGKYLQSGLILMVLGWLISFGTTIYDIPKGDAAESNGKKYAEHPVIPTSEQLAKWNFRSPELPFVPPPGIDQRKENYWLMSQRHGTLSYLIFSAGLSFVVFAGFIWLGEIQRIQIGMFRTLGVNALAGYVLHSVIGDFVKNGYLQKDSPALAVYTGFVVYFLLTYLVLRLMEYFNIRIRM